MGVDLSEVIPKTRTNLEELSGKSLAVDGYNTLYQFLAIIRQPDGTPLMDRSGRITSHLSGVLYRTANLVEKGIRVVYVFDGEPPELKEMEILRRRTVKEEATVKYEAALKSGDLTQARRYAQMTSKLKDSMVEDTKRLLDALGVPWVQAPSEGEAQAAQMAARSHVWATASQDHDALLFGTPRLVKNLTISGRRKLPRREAYVEVETELVELEKVLSTMELSRQQLVDLGILIGTDFNPDGVKGVGPKTALKLIREHGTLEAVLSGVKEIEMNFDYGKIREIFLKPEVTADYSLKWRAPDPEGVVHFLCGERDFSEERVRKAVQKFEDGMRKISEDRSKLESFFG